MSNKGYRPLDLYSVGHHVKELYKKPPPMIDGRDKSNTMLIGDSGGYQIGSGALRDDYSEKEMYEWLAAHTDVAMTIDIPPWMITKNKLVSPRDKFKFADCLDETIENMDLLEQNKYFDHKWLVVMQGENPAQAHTWATEMLKYEAFGYAFAGRMKINVLHMLRTLVLLYHHGKLHNDTWLHFLGISTLEFMAVMTVFQDAMREHWGLENATISFDSASPTRMAGVTETFYTGATITNSKLALQSTRFENYWSLMKGGREPFPFQNSKVAAHIKLQDLAVHKDDGALGFDDFTRALLNNHSIDLLQQSFAEMAAMMRMDRDDLEYEISDALLMTKDIINETMHKARTQGTTAAYDHLNDRRKEKTLLNAYSTNNYKSEFGRANYDDATGWSYDEDYGVDFDEAVKPGVPSSELTAKVRARAEKNKAAK